MALFTREGLVPDPALRVDEAEALPEDGLVLVPVQRWLQDGRQGRVDGLILAPTDPLDGLPPELGRIELQVELFTDGRVFSQARTLRRRHRFTGTISVSGPVLPDQAGFLFRCGVDAIVVPDDADPRPWTRAAERFRRPYQSAARGVGSRVRAPHD